MGRGMGPRRCYSYHLCGPAGGESHGREGAGGDQHQKPPHDDCGNQ